MSGLLTKAKQLESLLQQNREVRMPPNLREVTGYDPRNVQAEIEANERRFNYEVLHRRAGKSVMKVNKLLERAIDCPYPDGRYAYLGPTYSQTEDIAWTYLVSYVTKLYDNLGLEERKWIDRSKLAVWVPTHLGDRARVRLYGVDSPKQRLRGMYLDGAVFDEYSEMPPSVWTEQVRPMLSDENRAGVDFSGNVNQWADFIFTPKGRNHAYWQWRRAEMWFKGEAVKMADPDSGEEKLTFRDDTYACVYPVSRTGILSKAELDSAFHDMGKSRYQQEYECSFDAAIEGAIFAEALAELRDAGKVTDVPVNKHLPVNTAWDLGWDDATAIWFYQQQGELVRVIDYYEASGADLSHYADVMADRGYRYGFNLFPHDVEVHELGTGKSRASILRELGIRVTTVPRVKVKADAIAAGEALLPRCVFDATRCADGLDRMSLYRRAFDEKLGVLKQNPVHDWASHAADAWMTLAVGMRKYSGPAERDPHRMIAAEM